MSENIWSLEYIISSAESVTSEEFEFINVTTEEIFTHLTAKYQPYTWIITEQNFPHKIAFSKRYRNARTVLFELKKKDSTVKLKISIYNWVSKHTSYDEIVQIVEYLTKIKGVQLSEESTNRLYTEDYVKSEYSISKQLQYLTIFLFVPISLWMYRNASKPLLLFPVGIALLFIHFIRQDYKKRYE